MEFNSVSEFDFSELSDIQCQRLEELSDLFVAARLLEDEEHPAVAGESSEAPPTCSHLLQSCRHKDPHREAPRWNQLWKLRAISHELREEFERSLTLLRALEKQHGEVMQQIGKLHSDCGGTLEELERLEGMSDAVDERLKVFRATGELSRTIDSFDASTSLATFEATLEGLEKAADYLAKNHEFQEAREASQFLNRYRHRACTWLRGSFLRTLKRAEEEVEGHVWDQLDSGTVSTEVFYSPFRSLATLHKPFLGSLTHRKVLHSEYESALQELDVAYCSSRSRLVLDATSDHLCALRGTYPEEHRLQKLLSEAATYLTEVTQREQQLYNSTFDRETPSEGLQAFLMKLSKLFHEMVQPAIPACHDLEALRASAETLQTDFLEPGGIPPSVFATLKRLDASVQDALVARVRAEVDTSISRYTPKRADFGFSLQEEPRKDVNFPPIHRTLLALSISHGVVESDRFETLALSSIEACLAFLPSMSDYLRGPLSLLDDVGSIGYFGRELEQHLFLMKQILLLKEQMSMLDFHTPAERVHIQPNQKEDVNQKSWLATRSKRSGRLDKHLANACSSLLEAVAVRLGVADSNDENNSDLVKEWEVSLDLVIAYLRVFLDEASPSGRSVGAGELPPSLTQLFLEPLCRRLARPGVEITKLRKACQEAAEKPLAECVDLVRSIEVPIEVDPPAAEGGASAAAPAALEGGDFAPGLQAPPVTPASAGPRPGAGPASSSPSAIAPVTAAPVTAATAAAATAATPAAPVLAAPAPNISEVAAPAVVSQTPPVSAPLSDAAAPATVAAAPASAPASSLPRPTEPVPAALPTPSSSLPMSSEPACAAASATPPAALMEDLPLSSIFSSLPQVTTSTSSAPESLPQGSDSQRND